MQMVQYYKKVLILRPCNIAYRKFLCKLVTK